jgi:acyl-CoA thioester hydrolase
MTHDEVIPQRADYLYFKSIASRWMDNDAYKHVNNTVYYSYFDTVIHEYILLEGQLDYQIDMVAGFAVETCCRFLRPIHFPDVLDVGLRVGHLGNTSVRYEIGIFKQSADAPSAYGYFVHVFVNPETQKPTPIVDPLRNALARLLFDGDKTHKHKD